MVVFHKNISTFFCVLFFTVTITNGSEISVKDKSFPLVHTTREVKSNIVGGIDIVADTYPWFAEGLKRGETWHVCGGSLVAPEYVLTAAYSVVGGKKPGLVSYKIGALSLDDTVQNSVPQETIDIANVTVHPNYNTTTFENDFALVKLKQRSTIVPVKMDQGTVSPNYPKGEFLTTSQLTMAGRCCVSFCNNDGLI